MSLHFAMCSLLLHKIYLLEKFYYYCIITVNFEMYNMYVFFGFYVTVGYCTLFIDTVIIMPAYLYCSIVIRIFVKSIFSKSFLHASVIKCITSSRLYENHVYDENIKFSCHFTFTSMTSIG